MLQSNVAPVNFITFYMRGLGRGGEQSIDWGKCLTYPTPLVVSVEPRDLSYNPLGTFKVVGNNRYDLGRGRNGASAFANKT